MKIDLHCHTKKIKQGDPVTREVSQEFFVKKVIESDVKILAITNHNCFDFEQYSSFSDSVKRYCAVWPGVELDIQNNSSRWHLIIVANPMNAQAFADSVNSLIGSADLEHCSFHTQAVVECFHEHDVIYIPHFHKSPGIPDEDHKELHVLVNDECRIINETPNLRTLGVFSNHDYRVIIGSDVKDWNQYDKSDFAVLRLPVSSFSQFLLLTKKESRIVETILGEKNSRTVTVFPHPQNPIELTIFEEMNIVFGQKGTGKSEILRTMCTALEEQGLECVYYCGTDKEKGFEKLKSTADVVRDVSKVGAKLCDDEFQLISAWKEKSPTPFSRYLNWGKTKDNSANKAKMRITNATNQPLPPSKLYKISKEDYSAIDNAFDELEKIHYENYYSQEEKDSLFKTLNALRVRIKRDKVKYYIEKEAVRLSNLGVNKIKSIADKNSETASIPSTTGFYEFALNRMELRKSVLAILNSLDKPTCKEKEYLGDLEEKGKIYIQTAYRLISDTDARRQNFKLKINSLKSIYQQLQNISCNCLQSDIAGLVSTVVHECVDNEVSNVMDFLGVSKDIVSSDGNMYMPSSGEQGMLLLQRTLRQEAAAYILDEPELGMGNSYIEQSVRPQLSSLAKEHKTVVVATHSANIAVRSMPYMSIFRAHQNGEYFTYTGNPFIDLLTNVCDPSDIRNWRDESMHTLEGGEEAFYERKYVYESGSN